MAVKSLSLTERKKLALCTSAAALGFATLIAACSSATTPGPQSFNPPLPAASQTPGPQPPMPLNVPVSFHVTMVSSTVAGATFLTFAPNGDLIVSETNSGQVVAIKPGADVNSAANSVASGLERPSGLAFKGNDLYIATWTGVTILRNYPTGITPKTVYTGLKKNSGHNERALAIAPDGTSFFESSGSDCAACNETDSQLATIMRVSIDGSKASVYATGVRNASALAFDPQSQLWMVANQRDDVPSDHPAASTDEFDQVVANGNYGWPTCYADANGTRQPSPDSPVPNPSCSGQAKSTLLLPARSAPVGIAFDNGSMFPTQYKGGAFIALHGSGERANAAGYKILFVSLAKGQPPSYSDFITGWLGPAPTYTVSGRPSGVAVAVDGSLYISDDQNGYIYRVTYGP